MTPRLTLLALPLSLMGLSMPEDQRTLGGETSVVMRDSNAFSLPARNASPAHRRSFMVGNSLFKENWVASPATVKTRQGLGPLLNALSCSSCHFKDGRAAPPSSPDEAFVGLLVRLSVPGKNSHGDAVPVPAYGGQLQHRAIVGADPEGDVRVSYEEIKGVYPDGSSYALLRPSYEFRDLKWGPLPDNTQFSPRIAPAMIGLGLLAAIRKDDLLALADADDLNGDGISGRPNFVWDYEKKSKQLGRFGWKANQPTLEQQNAGAFLGDMGVTSPLFPQQNCEPQDEKCLKAPALPSPEISARDLEHMSVYTHLLAVPERRDVDKPTVKLGMKVFRRVGCQQCHVESFVTGDLPKFPELSRQKIHPFTDLLLHDMGPGLADDRDDFEANGREWRTPPLWGIGLNKSVNGHTRLLHDGRARDFEEAILWHGGESEASRRAFMESPKTERLALIKFLESL